MFEESYIMAGKSIDKELCNIVKNIRLEITKDPQTRKPLTQKEFAESIETTQGYIAEIENEKREPSKNILRKISEVYKVDIGFSSSGNCNLRINNENGIWPKENYNRFSRAVAFDQSDENPTIKAMQTEYPEITIRNLRKLIKVLEQERDDWKSQAMFLKGLLEKKD